VTDLEDFTETLGVSAREAPSSIPRSFRSWSRLARQTTLEELTTPEREVLALMAEGRSNVGIARRLWVTEGTVEKHVSSIMAKLRLAETADDHRRVLAVVTFLGAHWPGARAAVTSP